MKWKPAVVLASGCILLAGAGLFLARNRDPLHAPARKEWKEQAVAGIARRVSDAAWLEAEIRALKAEQRQEPAEDAGWFSDRLILMTNGDWIVYASACSKEQPGIFDIFLGRASDGKWYYSTYHFCVRLLVLREEDPSDNLAQFVARYSLREFDGHSDECLNLTWPVKRK